MVWLIIGLYFDAIIFIELLHTINRHYLTLIVECVMIIVLTKIPNQGEKNELTPWFWRSDSIQNGGQNLQLKADWRCVGSVNSVRQRIQDICDERRPERNEK